MIILEEGQVVQTGALTDVTAHPRSRYIADLVGVNLLTGTGRDGAIIITSSGGRIVPADHVDGPAFAVIQPHSVARYPMPPAGSPRNVWPATVVDIDRQADRACPRDRPSPARRRDHPGGPRRPRPARRRPDLGVRQGHEITTYPA